MPRQPVGDDVRSPSAQTQRSNGLPMNGAVVTRNGLLPMNRCRKRTPLPNPLPSEGRGKDLRRSAWFRSTRREVVRGNLSPALSSKGSKGGEGGTPAEFIGLVPLARRDLRFLTSSPTEVVKHPGKAPPNGYAIRSSQSAYQRQPTNGVLEAWSDKKQHSSTPALRFDAAALFSTQSRDGPGGRRRWPGWC
jgi:hypothetical protein